jgi:hypothetical protein
MEATSVQNWEESESSPSGDGRDAKHGGLGDKKLRGTIGQVQSDRMTGRVIPGKPGICRRHWRGDNRRSRQVGGGSR